MHKRRKLFAMIEVQQRGKTSNHKSAARVLSITAMPPKRRALSNLQRQETCKKRLELGQAAKTLSEFGKLFPDDQVWSIPTGRRGPATGSLDSRAKRGDFFFLISYLSGIAEIICMGAGINISRKASGPVFWW